VSFVPVDAEKVIESQTIYQGKLVTFQLKTVQLPNGMLAQREIVGLPGAVAIVPLTDDGQVRLVRQYRSPLGQFLLELPAGSLESGEAPARAAPRELAEETGDRADHWRLLASICTSPGVCDEILHIFLATGLTSGETNPDPDEFLEIVTLPFRQALAMAVSGEIQDAKTIIGLYLALEATQKQDG
jgi:ADP-ribose pyrophosphatase